jgi:hypothetical protein
MNIRKTEGTKKKFPGLSTKHLLQATSKSTFFCMNLLVLTFLIVISVISAAIMPFPAIQQKAPEFTVSALMPNKVNKNIFLFCVAK